MIPSTYPHVLYYVEDWDSYDTDRVAAGTTDNPEPTANVASSEVAGTVNMHTVMLDLDIPAALIPSSTPGHSHLYIDAEMPWETYERLLRALADAGVIEEGYLKASVDRKGTHLRLPGIKKETAQ